MVLVLHKQKPQMKHFIIYFILFSSSFIAQNPKGIIGSKNWFGNWTNFKPKSVEYDQPNQILSHIIDKNTTLTPENTYLISGVVYVTNNAIVTIEPGTVIRGDYETCGTLVFTKGSKLIAKGLESNPIIFTSNKEVGNRNPGDWGGIILLGDAPINKFGGVSILDFNLDAAKSQFGGNNNESNSGILNFVRIEFSGRKLNSAKELNALSLAGVGNKTELKNIQISFSNDDSFECYGGNVNLSNLISFRATDDDFDFTMGTQAIIQNSIAIRYPFSSDTARSRCFEVDSYEKIDQFDVTKKLFTTIQAQNITLVNNEDNEQELIREAIYLKDNVTFNISNSVISGFEKGFLLEKSIENHIEKLKNIKIKNIVIADCKNSISSELELLTESVQQYYFTDENNIKITDLKRTQLFNEIGIKKHPDFRLKEDTSITIR